MTPNEVAQRAAEAKHLLDNRLFKEAWDALAGYLESKAETCDPDNAEQARRIILTKQLLAGLKREFERVVNDGHIAAIQIAELERKKMFSVFRR